MIDEVLSYSIIGHTLPLVLSSSITLLLNDVVKRQSDDESERSKKKTREKDFFFSMKIDRTILAMIK